MDCLVRQRAGRVKAAEEWLFAWRGFVTLVAVLSLVITLADRTFHSANTPVVTVHSYPSKAKVQHRDKDANRWSVPLAGFLLLWSSRPVSRVALQEQPLLSLRVDDCCFNRPPPAGSISSFLG
jgi:hypothetical protein